MTLTLELPDDIARVLAARGNLSRRALEGFALEEYKSGRLSQSLLRRLLGFETRYELDGFLKSHGVVIDYPVEEFDRELESLRQAGF